MGVTGFQDFWIAGSRLYFKRDDVDGADQPLIDLGVLQSATPAMEITEAELKDADCGLRKTVAKQVTDITETYAIECSNFNPTNLALLFMGDPPEEFTQAATPLVDVPQDEAHKGYLLKIRDANGDPVYAITSIEAVKDSAGVITYDLGDDYEVVDLARGIIRIVESGDIVEDDNIKISFTPTAVTGLRTLNPQTQNRIEGELFLFYSRSGCDEQTVRHAQVSLTPGGATVPNAEDFASMTFNVTVLSDVTAAVPAGELLYFQGIVPDKS